MDTESEQKIVAFLDKSKLQRTTVVVAHRLSTIKSADNIIVMEKGVVVEEGSHNELLALGKVHAEYVKAGKSNELTFPQKIEPSNCCDELPEGMFLESLVVISNLLGSTWNKYSLTVWQNSRPRRVSSRPKSQVMTLRLDP